MREKTEFTTQQLLAVDTFRDEKSRGPLLVSAGAGSGKTRVLVERLLRSVTGDNGCDITEFLVITYTRAAAGELRARILEEISKRLAAEPDNRHLRRQAALVYQASIGTIHSFCADILRENAHAAGLSPDFRVADENEAEIIRDKVLEELLDKRYETVAETPGFALLVDTMSAGRDDKKLKNIIRETYAKLQSHADPSKWVQAQIAALNTGTQSDASETVWGRFLMDDARKKAGYWLGFLRRLQVDTACHPEFEKAYGESVAASADGLERFYNALSRSWDEARELARVPFPRPKNVRGFEELKERRQRCKKALEKLAGVFECASADLLEDMAAVGPAVSELLNLVLEFDRMYAEAKRKRGLADYSDLEHLTARILTDFETGAPTETARAVSRRFREILVDEYQDVSRVQELIFSAVSQDGKNLFMVGDVRQSIYRFRLADPTIFLEKYKTFRDAGEGEEDGGRRVLLTVNFRSRAGILEAVNYVFKNVMSEEIGEMAYTEREFLSAGRTDGDDSEPAVELDVLDMNGLGTEEDGEDPEKTAVEADFVAARIEQMLRRGYPIPDGQGGTRPADCGDFAILLRSVKDKAAVYEKALYDRGIPAALPAGEDFFKLPEVSVALSLLSIIDNPLQDIPLIAALRSPVYGFTPDELAQIRSADPNASFYGALVKAARTDLKCRAFLNELESFRRIAPDMPADRFLWHVYNKTDMLAVMGALRGGDKRRQNLMKLADLAVRSQANGYKGLFGFMTLVRRLIENGEEPFLDGGGSAVAGAVKIMSIHKSKGLEFPVVILADTAKRFNRKDAAAPLLVHPTLGIGAKRTELDRRIEYPTLPRLAVARKLAAEMLSEELRILYVAMTRAREKLIIVGTFKDADKELIKLARDAGSPVAPQALENAAGLLSFILLPAMARPEAECLRPSPVPVDTGCGIPWDIRKIKVDAAPKSSRAAAADVPERAEPEPGALEDARRKLSFVYPYIAAAGIPSKLTATGLKGRFADFEAAEDAEPLAAAAKRAPVVRPAFIANRTSLTPAERGTALHLAMQYIDYSRCTTLGGVRDELRRLKEKAFLSRRQAEAVDPEKILAFFASDLGKRVLNADKIYREFKFSLLVPAEEYYPGVQTGGGDEILLQGVVDCCFSEGEALHVIDFKTDAVTLENIEEKTRQYAAQLAAYGRAMERILGLPVKDRLVYFFALNTFRKTPDIG